MLENEGSVRIDLVGGTLDIPPLHLIIKDAITLNLATSLKAKVRISETTQETIKIISKDYQTTYEYSAADFTQEKLFYSEHFGPMKFVAQILNYFGLKQNLCVELESGSPPGAGLGGSSSMGVTLFNALCRWQGVEIPREDAVQIVRDIEARILNAGMTGYQDYYPALYGGVLALKPKVGTVEVEQLYSSKLASYLEDHITLIYTGKTRLSGINNWEVYKNYFDKDQATIKGMSEIAAISARAYNAIKTENFDEIISLISQEGSVRRELFPNIETPEMTQFFNTCMQSELISGMKVCGAGGGGCFLVVHNQRREQLLDKISEYSFQHLNFCINAPL